MPLVSFSSDFEDAANAIAPYGLVFRDLIVNAIAKERERCANIAESIDSGRGNEKEIARAIRGVVSAVGEGK
jgi:hypothetical protein